MKKLQQRQFQAIVAPKVLELSSLNLERTALRRLIDQQTEDVEHTKKMMTDTEKSLFPELDQLAHLPEIEARCKRIRGDYVLASEENTRLLKTVAQLERDSGFEDVKAGRVMSEIITLVRRLCDVDKATGLRLIR